MSDDRNDPDGIGRIVQLTETPNKQRVVGPPEKPVEVAKRNLAELENRVTTLETDWAHFANVLPDELDEAFGDVWSTLQTMLMVQGALVEAVQALTDNPGQPHHGADKASTIINEAMEAAYGPDEGQSDNGVVPQPTGDQPGDS